MLEERYIVLVFKKSKYDCILDGLIYKSKDNAKKAIEDAEKEDLEKDWGKYVYILRPVYIEG